MGFADEIRGGLGALAETVAPTDTTQDTGLWDRIRKMPEMYRDYRDIARDDAAQAQADQPAAYIGGQVAGSLVPGSAALRGASTLGGAVLRGAGTGATAGLGSGEGEFEEQLKSTAIGAASGAVAGAAGRGISRGIDELSDLAIRGASAADDMAVRNVVDRLVKKAQQEGGKKLTKGAIEGIKESVEDASMRVADRTGGKIDVALLMKEMDLDVPGVLRSLTIEPIKAAGRGISALGRGDIKGATRELGAPALTAGVFDPVTGLLAGMAQTGAREMGPRVVSSVANRAANAITSYGPTVQRLAQEGMPMIAINANLTQTDPKYRQAAMVLRDEHRRRREQEGEDTDKYKFNPYDEGEQVP
jgi:hypothetical protein